MDESSFDIAAEKARENLKEMLKTFSEEQRSAVYSVAAWFGVWFMTAGHKRLGRIMVLLSKGLL